MNLRRSATGKRRAGCQQRTPHHVGQAFQPDVSPESLTYLSAPVRRRLKTGFASTNRAGTAQTQNRSLSIRSWVQYSASGRPRAPGGAAAACAWFAQEDRGALQVLPDEARPDRGDDGLEAQGTVRHPVPE